MFLGLSLSLSGSRAAGGGGPPGPTYAPEAEALFARMTTPPDTTRKGLIDTCIKSLLLGATSATNIWATRDVLQVYAAADSQAAILNWISSSYNGAEVSSPTFTADRGFTGNGTSSYIDMGFSDTQAGANWSRDSAGFGAYVNQDNGATSAPSIGHATSGDVRIIPNNASTASFRLHNSASVTTTAGTRAGLNVGVRTTSTAVALYRNGASVITGPNVSLAPVAGNIHALHGATGFSNDRVAVAMIGGQLNAAENLDLYNAILAYLTAIGGN
jgi:hypothetical protein